jgi:hypothetical protein
LQNYENGSASTNLALQWEGGYVGIGTTAPNRTLTVNGVLGVASGTTNVPELALSADGSGTYISSTYKGTSSYQPLVFETNGSEKVRITTGGNVGIGTTSPNAQLDAFTTQGGSTIAATHGTGGTYPKASGISFGATSTSLSVSNNGGTVVFTGGAGIYANNTASSNNPTELVFWTTSGGTPAARLTIASTGAATFSSSVEATSFIKTSGTASQYLMADGSVSTLTNPVTGTGTTNYVPKFTSASAIGNSQVFDNGTNVGIGTASPSSKLHVNGTVSADAAFADSSAVRILKPNGGSLVTASPSVSGAIKITYPVGFTNTMHRVKVNVYEYSTNMAFTLFFGGYNYAPDSSWYNTFAYIVNNPIIDRNFTIRFGYDGAKLVVYVGELNSTWTYPQVFIEEVELGYGGQSNAWRDDSWAIAFEATAFQNVNSNLNIANSQATNWVRNGANAYYGLGNVGIGTTSPAVRLDYGASLNQAFHLHTSGVDYYGINMTQYDSGPYSTNIFSGDGGQIKFRTATGTSTQTTRMTITQAGNVGIGTTAPKSKLQILGPTLTVNNENTYAVWVSDTGDDTKALLLGYDLVNDVGVIQAVDQALSWKSISIASNGGNVGIGTTAPGAKLDVNGDIWLSETGRLQGRAYPYDTTVGSGADASTAIIEAGSTAGYRSRIALAGGSATDPNTIKFLTASSERMRITSAGNVGIGTTAPNKQLTLKAPASNYAQFALAGGDTSAFWNLYAFNDNSSFNIAYNGTTSILSVTSAGAATFSGTVTASSLIKSGGTSAQYLMADGSVSTLTNPVTGTGTTNYIPKFTSASAIGNSAIYDNAGNVGINTTAPKTKLDINETIGFGSKSMSMTDTFAAALTINMADHSGCYVKITAFGDWGNHSTIAYLGEFFIQASAGAYNEPGMIIRQVDNTSGGDDIQAQIVDPAGTGTRDFVIQLKATSSGFTPFTAVLQYEVRGQYNSVS